MAGAWQWAYRETRFRLNHLGKVLHKPVRAGDHNKFRAADQSVGQVGNREFNASLAE